MRYRFEPFEVDVARRRLLRDGAPVALTSKALETLLALVEGRGQIVEKDELMCRLWPATTVEEGNLTQQISTLRKVLGEGPDDHRFIVTVARRGYRFVAPVTVPGDAEATRRAERAHEPAPVRPTVRSFDHRTTVGREAELQVLRQRFAHAAAGAGCLVYVTGEPGIGKSTLVARFLDEVAADCLTFVGRCSERLAPGEPYLPVLEALESFLRHAPDGAAAQLMAARAPTWYAQIAPLVGAPSAPVIAPGATQSRQNRELAAFFLELSHRAPVVLFLDDLHWADVSTLDLLLHLATRIDDARLLLIAAYRPTELFLAEEAFVHRLGELQARRLVTELKLGFLSPIDTATYLAIEFPRNRFTAEFPALVHQQTEGNPLFLVDLVRELRERGAMSVVDGCWTLTMSLADVARDLPESIRSMVARAIDRLAPVDRQLLICGSVQGTEFDSIVVGSALDLDAEQVEERLDRLDRVHGLVRRVGRYDAVDGTPNVRYAFVHVLYHDALRASLPATRRIALSAAVGDALQATSCEPPHRLAHQLALLFEAGRRRTEAVDKFLLAAQNAAGVGAPHEAASLARRGLAIAAQLPATPEHLGRELQLLITLGVPQAATTGYASPDVERTYTRARELCDVVGDPRGLFAVLSGQWVLYHVRADLRRALRAAEDLLRLGEQTGDARILQGAHTALGYTRGHLGDLQAALSHLTSAESCHDTSHHEFWRSINALDPAVASLCQQGRVLCLLGFPERASEKAAEGLALARSIGMPNAIGFALVWSAYVHQLRTEPHRVRTCTEEALALAMEHGLADVQGWAAVWHAWAGSDPRQSLAVMSESLAAQRSFGSEIARPHQLALVAEVLIRAGEIDTALLTIEEALEHATRTGDCYYEPELHRLQGEMHLMIGTGSAADRARTAEVCFRRAVSIARRQGAQLLEERAIVSLTSSGTLASGDGRATTN
jgi:DNA-binding winged helix-turn-helix (wHTH) protein/predicted ATPase